MSDATNQQCTTNAAEICPIEQIGVAVFPKLQQPRPHLRAGERAANARLTPERTWHNRFSAIFQALVPSPPPPALGSAGAGIWYIEGDRVRTADLFLAVIQIAPVDRRKDVSRVSRMVQIKRQPNDRLLIAPFLFIDRVPGGDEQGSSIPDDAPRRPDPAFACSGHPGAENPSRVGLNADNSTMIIATVSEITPEGDVKAAANQCQSTTLIFQARRESDPSGLKRGI
ncbi:MAG: hypothetical protein JO122_13880 [Acetobacteraceae bacterium]|nr:hypothetical protein [Acetobacteraceae bacterium]